MKLDEVEHLTRNTAEQHSKEHRSGRVMSRVPSRQIDDRKAERNDSVVEDEKRW